MELFEQLYTVCSKLANKSLEIKPSVNVITVQEAKLLQFLPTKTNKERIGQKENVIFFVDTSIYV